MSPKEKSGARPQGEDSLDEHIPWLRRLTRSLVLDQSRADDVLQQVFLLALRKKPSRDRDIKPWLASVARKVAFNQRRSEARRLKYESGASKEKIVTVEIQPANQSELAQLLKPLIGDLSEPCRASIQLHFIEGLSVAEVAQRLRIPKPTAQTRIRRGLLQLRAKMDKKFGDRLTWSLLLLPVLEPADAIPVAQTDASAAMHSKTWISKLKGAGAGKTGSVAAAFAIFALPATIALIAFNARAGHSPGEQRGAGEITTTLASPAEPDSSVSLNETASEDSSSPTAMAEDEGEENEELSMSEPDQSDPAHNGGLRHLPVNKNPKGKGKKKGGGGEAHFIYHKNGELTPKENGKPIGGNPKKKPK